MAVNANIKDSPTASAIDFRQIHPIWLRRFLAYLTNHHWWILSISGLVIIVLQTRDHFASKHNLSVYLTDILSVILVIVMTGFLVRMLLSSLADRNQALKILRMKHDIGMELSTCHDLSDVSHQLANLIAQIVPSSDINLAIFEASRNTLVPSFRFAAREIVPGAAGENPFINGNACLACLGQRGILTEPLLHRCERNETTTSGLGAMPYCLPLIRGGALTGVVRLIPPRARDLTVFQNEILEDISTTVGSTIYLAQEKKAWEEEAVARTMKAFQEDMARDLHDTVAQNISFLRLKLDHLVEINAERMSSTADLEQMVSVAGETYDLVRGTLSMLRSGAASDLRLLITQYSRQVTDRSGIEIQVQVTGEPGRLSLNATRQLFYIYREALSNIEKYAHASKVQVRLIWNADRTMTMEIADNGCGFDPAVPGEGQGGPQGHYGLKFMRERAEQLKGTCSIVSRIQQGTQITVRVPI